MKTTTSIDYYFNWKNTEVYTVDKSIIKSGKTSSPTDKWLWMEMFLANGLTLQKLIQEKQLQSSKIDT